jgi:hypothetical protein
MPIGHPANALFNRSVGKTGDPDWKGRKGVVTL